MSKPKKKPAPMPQRPFRIDDKTYNRAMRKAKRMGTKLSKVVREFVKEWGKK